MLAMEVTSLPTLSSERGDADSEDPAAGGHYYPGGIRDDRRHGQYLKHRLLACMELNWRTSFDQA